MYRPQHFRSKSYKRSIEIIEQNPLATVITGCDEGPDIAMTPVLINQEEHQLEGHFALQNDIWHKFKRPNTTTFLFQGPHGYISPAWYITSPHLPTWNYAVVEVTAEVVLIDVRKSVIALLDKLTRHFDRNFSRYSESEEYVELIANAAAGVICFKAKIVNINSKFKLSQNKQSADIKNLIGTLRTIEPNRINALADLMQAELNDQSKE